MSELTEEIAALWKQYHALDVFSIASKYQSYDEQAYDGDGVYYKSAEGFLMWVVDGCPTDGKVPDGK